jgi:hypothetical protein
LSSTAGTDAVGKGVWEIKADFMKCNDVSIFT